MNFADESACLTADNVHNEFVTIHRSQEMLKMLSPYTDIRNFHFKKTGTTIVLALPAHDTNFYWMEQDTVD
jgi:hypothetical protein